MKTPRLLIALALLASVNPVFAQLNIPAADGSDLDFSPASSVEVDLSNAVPGDALTYSNSGVAGANRGRGIYDSVRWVVVYKYSSVNIPTGVTVTFKNHPSGAPVVWLVQGAVTIAGTVSVNGKPGVVGPGASTLPEGGPGGFRGGAGSTALGNSVGLGPGGGIFNNPASHNTVYGNPAIFPLIGGSGGGGTANGPTSGSGGGGAILIATPGTITLTNGNITALAGTAVNSAGSAGSVKLIANQVTGTGILNASTTGRIRVEATLPLPGGISTFPVTVAVTPLATPILFPGSSDPFVKIVSVDGKPMLGDLPPNLDDPRAPLESSADVSIQRNTAPVIEIRTYNFATSGAVVTLRVADKYGSVQTRNATRISGTSADSLWHVTDLILPPGFCTLQVRAIQN
jgi:hypothetical protein